jgi:hypothetical protein
VQAPSWWAPRTGTLPLYAAAVAEVHCLVGLSDEDPTLVRELAELWAPRSKLSRHRRGLRILSMTRSCGTWRAPSGEGFRRLRL